MPSCSCEVIHPYVATKIFKSLSESAKGGVVACKHLSSAQRAIGMAGAAAELGSGAIAQGLACPPLETVIE